MKGNEMIVLDHVAGREAAALLVDGKSPMILLVDDDDAPRVPVRLFIALIT